MAGSYKHRCGSAAENRHNHGSNRHLWSILIRTEPNRADERTTRAVRDDEPQTSGLSGADDPARRRADAERRFVLRCARCHREIAKSEADAAGWEHLPLGSVNARPYCPTHAPELQAVVATCIACGTKIAARAAVEFGWRSWPDASGVEELLCAACGARRAAP